MDNNRLKRIIAVWFLTLPLILTANDSKAPQLAANETPVKYSEVEEKSLEIKEDLVSEDQTPEHSTEEPSQLTSEPIHPVSDKPEASEGDVPTSVVNMPSLKLKPYLAEYQIYDRNKVMGVARRQLNLDNNEWTLEMTTQLKTWLFKYNFTEATRFLIIDNRVRTLAYQSSTERSFKKDRDIESNFDWQDKIEHGKINGRTWKLPLNDGIYDHLSYQVALKLLANEHSREEAFQVSYKGSREIYHFVNEGLQVIDSPIGKIKAILYVQQPKNPKDKFVMLWLAPDLGNIPVQLAQYKNGKPEGIIKITSLNWL